ncbi:hypothetical protein [Streptomyces anulatus]|uniref:hypothetical protein n=1 Tax=Streptomyces anulatus TaxID=1892 RepID=UPI0037249887
MAADEAAKQAAAAASDEKAEAAGVAQLPGRRPALGDRGEASRLCELLEYGAAASEG